MLFANPSVKNCVKSRKLISNFNDGWICFFKKNGNGWVKKCDLRDWKIHHRTARSKKRKMKLGKHINVTLLFEENAFEKKIDVGLGRWLKRFD